LVLNANLSTVSANLDTKIYCFSATGTCFIYICLLSTSTTIVDSKQIYMKQVPVFSDHLYYAITCIM